MTLSSRHRIWNLSPGGLRPSTLPLGHGGSPQYWLSHVNGEETFCFFQTAETGNRTPNSSVIGSGANHYPRAPALADAEDVGLPTKFRFNVGQASQPIAGSMPVNRLRRWALILHWVCYILWQTRAIHPIRFNVDLQSSTLARHCNSIGWLYRVFRLLHCYAGDAFYPDARNTR